MKTAAQSLYAASLTLVAAEQSVRSNTTFSASHLILKAFAALLLLTSAQIAIADYVFTFDVTVNERRIADRNDSFQAHLGELDADFTPITLRKQFHLTTSDLTPYTNSLGARGQNPRNLRSHLYEEMLSLSPYPIGVGPTLFTINQMSVREPSSFEPPNPIRSWAAAKFSVRESDDITIDWDHTNPSVHFVEYAEWELRTEIRTQPLPIEFNHEPLEFTPESLFSFMDNYQHHGGLVFDFSMVGSYEQTIFRQYFLEGLETLITYENVDFKQVGYTGTATLVGISQVPVPPAFGLFISAIAGLFSLRNRQAGRDAPVAKR